MIDVLLCEKGSFHTNPITVLHFSLQIVQHAVKVHSTEDLLLHQGELLSRGQLPLARKAGKAGQVIHVALGPADPVSRVDVPATAGTAGPIPSEVIEFTENVFILNVAARVPSQGRSADTAGETADMPA